MNRFFFAPLEGKFCFFPSRLNPLCGVPSGASLALYLFSRPGLSSFEALFFCGLFSFLYFEIFLPLMLEKVMTRK